MAFMILLEDVSSSLDEKGKDVVVAFVCTEVNSCMTFHTLKVDEITPAREGAPRSNGFLHPIPDAAIESLIEQNVKDHLDRSLGVLKAGNVKDRMSLCLIDYVVEVLRESS